MDASLRFVAFKMSVLRLGHCLHNHACSRSMEIPFRARDHPAACAHFHLVGMLTVDQRKEQPDGKA